jgi:hypothetical protein
MVRGFGGKKPLVMNQFLFAFMNDGRYFAARIDGSLFSHTNWEEFYKVTHIYCDSRNVLQLCGIKGVEYSEVYLNSRYTKPFVYVHTAEFERWQQAVGPDNWTPAPDNIIVSLRFLKDSEIERYATEVDPEERYYAAVATCAERFAN